MLHLVPRKTLARKVEKTEKCEYGMQVEYAFPPLIPGNSVDSHDTPLEWKHLPSLALPDGAHNYTKDTIYFHLPSLTDKHSTVFGISCYRQIDSGELLNREADITRNTVQKCVCVLSTMPLYGLLQAKLELITHAYFKERDFTHVSLLEETFTSLNSSINTNTIHSQQMYLGLSGRDVVRHFKHKILILFKLMLLERRVLFFGSPVETICSAMLTTLSLIPGMLEHGLKESASYTPKRLLSPTLKVTRINSNDNEDFLEVHYTNEPKPTTDAHGSSTVSHESRTSKVQSSPSTATKTRSQSDADAVDIEKITHLEPVQGILEVITTQPTRSRNLSEPHGEVTTKVKSLQRSFSLQDEEICELESDQQMEDLLETEECFNWDEDKLLLEIDDSLASDSDSKSSRSPRKDPNEHDSKSSKTLDCVNANYVNLPSKDVDSNRNDTLVTNSKPDNLSNLNISSQKMEDVTRSASPSTLVTDEFGLPLSIFTKGNLCHPYLCLQYYDLLSDVNIRAMLIGATNQLFKQKRHLLDVIVEVLDTRMTINDPELRKQLTLTTADLRFADYLVKSVCGDEKSDEVIDETEWEGGEEWLRGQFRLYILGMVATVHSNDDKLIEDFNPSYITAWKTTHNYKQWAASSHEGTAHIVPGHPFHGQLSMADMKLRLSHTMQSTERGKKINAAVQQTGKAVINTTKVVGGALNTAKSAVSKTVTSWFSGFGSGPSPETRHDKDDLTS